jgi:hypothetical protein
MKENFSFFKLEIDFIESSPIPFEKDDDFQIDFITAATVCDIKYVCRVFYLVICRI